MIDLRVVPFLNRRCAALRRAVAVYCAVNAFSAFSALVVFAGSLIWPGVGHAESEAAIDQEPPVYSSTLRADYPRVPLWGDTHLHTRLSQDAYAFGVTLEAEQAYRFAKGDVIKATHGQSARLARPLDFLVIADHANGMGSMAALEAGNPALMKSPMLREWKKLLEAGGARAGLQISEEGRMKGWPDELNDRSILSSAWTEVIDAAERHNAPGAFTAFIGYEWTSWPGGSNLHRVVVYRDGADRVRRTLPFSSFESDDPEDLWSYLASYEEKTGGQVLAIPHNGNLSNGLLFAVEDRKGNPIDADYAKRRARWEPITEATQIKGDGEAHPFLSPNDEFANYETWDVGNFAGVPKTNEMLEFEYVRGALKNGVKLYGELGANPFKFGLIGSTDSHTALATADEDNFFGKHSAGMEPSATRSRRPVGKAGEFITLGWQQAASGYAAVWAKGNTRESIWDAMARREVYATTGPRMTLRFFGGWSFKSEDKEAGDLAGVGYAKGVPMGADLPANPNSSGGSAPRFLIAAQRDPIGANLDRIQVVKGWADAQGQTQERVYDVAWSNTKKRKIDRKGRLTPVGNTVDARKAAWTNAIGATELVTMWKDPDFEAGVAAFYYVRVLEIPTPRWTDYDAKVFGGYVPDEVISVVNQERAYSSPIWYTP